MQIQTQLTDAMIIRDLSSKANLSMVSCFLCGIIFIILLIVWIISLKKREQKYIYKFNAVVLPFLSIISVIGFFSAFNYYFTTNNYIKDGTWSVVTDKILNTEIVTQHRRRSSNYYFYYIDLAKYGRVKVDELIFYKCSKGDSVYLVVTKEQNGEDQPTGLLYPTKQYVYKKQTH